MQLTQQGEIFLKSALKVLEANQECYQMIQYLHHENFGQLRIGYLKGIEHCIMIKNIQNFINTINIWIFSFIVILDKKLKIC